MQEDLNVLLVDVDLVGVDVVECMFRVFLIEIK